MGKRAPSTERMNLLYSNDTQGNYPESWYSATTQHLNAFPSLKGSRKYDICIIGAGYTGLSAALHLSKLGCCRGSTIAPLIIVTVHVLGVGLIV